MSIADLASDNLSGAGEILAKACALVDDLLERGLFSNNLKHLTDLISAQPRMATMFNLVNFVLNKVWKKGEGLAPGFHPGKDFLLQYEKAEQNIIEQVKRLLEEQKRVCIFSRSSLVIKALLSIQENQNDKIYLSESRPMREGQVAARELVEHGFQVEYMVDAALIHGVKKSDLVLVGADAFSPEYFVNKTGTYALSLIASHFDKPLFVAAPTQKFIPTYIKLPPEQPHSAAEIWQNASGIEIVNLYFEDIPANLVSGFITEKGQICHKELKKLERSYSLNQHLAEYKTTPS